MNKSLDFFLDAGNCGAGFFITNFLLTLVEPDSCIFLHQYIFSFFPHFVQTVGYLDLQEIRIFADLPSRTNPKNNE